MPKVDDEFKEEEGNFQVGDMVGLLKIYSPDMIIYDDGNSSSDGSYKCGWFDEEDNWQTQWFRKDFLRSKE